MALFASAKMNSINGEIKTIKNTGQIVETGCIPSLRTPGIHQTYSAPNQKTLAQLSADSNLLLQPDQENCSPISNGRIAFTIILFGMSRNVIKSKTTLLTTR